MYCLPQNITVLIVESDDDFKRLLKFHIDDSKLFTVNMDSCYSLEEALFFLKENRYDVILLSDNLPDSKGPSTYEAIFRVNIDTPILLFTDLDDEESAITAIRSGVQDYLVKGRVTRNIGAILDRIICYAIERRNIVATLKLSEGRYRAIIDSQAELIFRTNRNRKIIFANKAFCDFVGKRGVSVLSKDFIEVLGLESEENIVAGLKDINILNLSNSFEDRSIVNDRIRWLSLVISGVFDDENNILEYQVIGTDITDKIVAQNRLLASMEEKRALLSSVPAGIYFKDIEGRYILANDYFFEMLDVTKKQAIGKTDFDILDEEDAVFWSNIDKYILDKKEPVANVERLVTTISSRNLWISVNKTPYYDSFGTIIGIVGSVIDITDKKIQSLAIAKKEQQLQLVIEGSNDAFWDYNCVTGEVEVSKRWSEILGFEPKELVLNIEAWRSILEEEYKEEFDELLSLCLAGKLNSFEFEYKIRTKNGSYKWILSRGKIVEIEDGKPLRATGTHTDINDRKIVEIALMDSERKLRDILNFLPDAIFAVNTEGMIISWSKAMEDLTGVPESSILFSKEYAVNILGSNQLMLTDVIVQEANITEVFAKNISEKQDKLYGEYLTINGKYLSAVATVLYDSDGNDVGAIESLRDITEKKKIERQIREERDVIQAMCNNITDMIWAKDLKGKYTFANKTMCERLLGKHPKEVIGRDNQDLGLALVCTPSDNKIIRDLESASFVDYCKDTKGEDIWLDINKAPVIVDNSIVGIVGTARDVTVEVLQRKQEEAAMQQLESAIQNELQTWKAESRIKYDSLQKEVADVIEVTKQFADSIKEAVSTRLEE